MKKITPYILLIATLMLLFSCNDEEQFTVDTNANITFSQDTIAFDTVFTTIGSSTKNFQVYNNNDKGVKLSRVNLASGGASGFRINVDGQYGTSFSDIEILKKDSIFVFVEVTVNPQDSDSPILICDSLQFTLENGNRKQVILEAYGQDILIMKGQTIENDTTLFSVRPIVVYDSLVVKENATLTIDAGTTLCFHSGASLDVHGKLIAKGTAEKPVTLRGDRTDKMFPYLPYDRLDGQWEGIHLYEKSIENVLDFVDIHGGKYGVLCDSTGIDKNKVTILNSSIHNVQGSCISSISNKLLVANSQLTNAGDNCITLLGGDSEFYHVTVGQFYPWSSYNAALWFTNSIEDTPYPLTSLKFFNSIITGYQDDVIAGSRFTGATEEETNSIAFNIAFHNCLVATDTIGSSQYFTDCVIEHKDSVTCGATNFKSIDTDIYAYDFRLDSLSRAIGIANSSYSNPYVKDKNGVTRKNDHPDAGCYEYTK